MSKIKTWLITTYKKINGIESDKLLHRLFGQLICAVVALDLLWLTGLSLEESALLGAIAAFVAGMIKDYVVDKLIGGTTEFNDVLWTLYGGVDILVLLVLVDWILK